MFLRQPFTITPAGIAANRRNARKSPGPRAGHGKAPSRRNGLPAGGRSHAYCDLMLTLFSAPPCAVDRTAGAVLTPEPAAHALFAEFVEIFRQTEIKVVREGRFLRRWRDFRKRILFLYNRSHYVYENKQNCGILPGK